MIKTPSEVDKYIKVKVLSEAIKFMKNKNKRKRAEVEVYKGWHRIMPCELSDEYDIFYKLKKVYDRLCERKGVLLGPGKF